MAADTLIAAATPSVAERCLVVISSLSVAKIVSLRTLGP